MRKIPLTQGKFALVDEDDYQALADYKWFYTTGYAARSTTKSERETGLPKILRMHRSLTNAPDNMDVDHINNIPLDNRRSNIRVVTHQQNLVNRGKQSNNTSGYKGVFYDNRVNRWYTHIVFMKRAYHFGSFSNPKEAALEYDNVVEQLFGGFARLNFPESA